MQYGLLLGRTPASGVVLLHVGIHLQEQVQFISAKPMIRYNLKITVSDPVSKLSLRNSSLGLSVEMKVEARSYISLAKGSSEAHIQC